MAGGRRENKMKFLIFLSLILVFTTGILYGDDILLNISACPKTHWTLKYSVTYKDQSKNILCPVFNSIYLPGYCPVPQEENIGLTAEPSHIILKLLV